VVGVNEQGVALETFKASLVASGVFLENVINTGETNTTSRVIKGNIVRDGSDVSVTALTNFADSISLLTTGPFATSFNGSVTAAATGGRFAKLVGTAATNLAGGTNGIAATENGRSTALIGSTAVEPKTGMQALDDDVINVGVALVPGVATQEVQNALITLAETTQDFMALVAPPYAVGTVQDAIDWTNGQSSTTGSRTTAINSSFAAVHWPWVKVFSTFDGKDRWYDPSIFAARQMAYTDSVADTWFAPAGFRRGRLTKPTEVEVKLNQGDRDSLYSGGNIVNPIVSFPQQGLTIFGQRTGQRSPSSLDRINIRRLMIYVRKVILASTQRFVFEPNDEFTWSQIEGVVNPFLDDIRRRRGITEFRVVCDETTNTPLRVDRNELWTKVLLKPTKTAEVIVFEINLTNQSADLGTL
jgi:phage tail sheath protein FI